MAETICASWRRSQNAPAGRATAIPTAVLLWLADRDAETKLLARVRQIVTLPQERLLKGNIIPMAECSSYGGAIAEEYRAVRFVGRFLRFAFKTAHTGRGDALH
ncbi:MAG: hypothetical protein IPL18_13030 [Sphingomonadales bacterium]|nr:hypothetical protein [Sphingomonadales bacterium]